jgi:hypothetical protein
MIEDARPGVKSKASTEFIEGMAYRSAWGIKGDRVKKAKP